MSNEGSLTGPALSGADVVEIVKVYVDLREHEGSYLGYCPLCHKDDMSFEVDPERALWQCSQCGREGDVYQLFTRIRRTSRENAIRFVSRLHESIQRSAQNEPAVARVSQQEAPPRRQPTAPARASANIPADPRPEAPSIPSTSAAPMQAALPIDTLDRHKSSHPRGQVANGTPDEGLSRADQHQPAAGATAVGTEMQLDFRQIVDRIGTCLVTTETCLGLVAVRDDRSGEPGALVYSGSDLDRHDALTLDKLMRKVLGSAAIVLGKPNEVGNPSILTLRATRQGEPLELLWSTVEQGEHRFNVLLRLTPKVSDGLAFRRLHSCLSDAAQE